MSRMFAKIFLVSLTLMTGALAAFVMNSSGLVRLVKIQQVQVQPFTENDCHFVVYEAQALPAVKKPQSKLSFVQSSVPKKAVRRYVVQKGDSIEKIARMFALAPYMLRAANGWGLHHPMLQPGQVVNVPEYRFKPYRGLASWYGPGFHGKRAADGSRYNMHEVSVAHRHMPLGTMVRITNAANGKFIVAEVKDRGPYVDTARREIDLSYRAAQFLGAIKSGIIQVYIEPVS